MRDRTYYVPGAYLPAKVVDLSFRRHIVTASGCLVSKRRAWLLILWMNEQGVGRGRGVRGCDVSLRVLQFRSIDRGR